MPICPERGVIAVLAAALLLHAAAGSMFAAGAIAEEDGSKAIKATLLADVDGAAPGSQFTLGVHLKIAPHWHTYWINPGEFGNAPEVKLRGPAGFEFGNIQWPLPHKIDANGSLTYGYEDQVMLLIPVKVSPTVSAQGEAKIEADVSWLVCHEACIPGEAKLALTLPMSGESKPANAAQFQQWRERLPLPDERAPQVVTGVEQANNTLTVNWKNPPHKVEWFPAATLAVAIETVAVKHDGGQTRIEFNPTVYDADAVPGGRVDSVLVYEDAQGNRRGVTVPFTVKVVK